MNFKQLVMLVAATLFGCGSLHAQTDFFWSLNALNSGATNADLVTEFAPGESGTLYLYYTTNGPADSDIGTGAYVDIATSESGIIEFTAAETFEFDILFFEVNPVGVRWGTSFGATASITADFIDELNAFTIFGGEGMLEAHNGSGALRDAGYDSGADAFLYAKVDFTVSPDAEGGTMVDLMTTPGTGGIVNNFQTVPVVFGGASIMVTENVMLGDMNGDGTVSMCDVNPFVQAILSDVFNEVADINGDERVNLLDVRPFVDILMN